MDAMPACWINLSVERRHSVLSIIKGIYERATANEEPVKWTKEDVLRLTAYVKMDEVYKLRACYLVAKKDPSVIVGTTEEEDKEAAEKAQSESEAQLSNSAKNIQDFFSYHPRRLLDKHKANRNNKEVQCKLFDHLTNYTAQSMWDSNKELEPSSYLDAFMSDEQKTLLKPTYKNCLMGYILYDVKGKGATQKLAKRWLDMITGNISSYSRCLNDTKRLKQIQEVNQLAATVAQVTADMDQEKDRKKTEAANREQKRKQKKKDDQAKEAAKQDCERPAVQLIMDDFIKGTKPSSEFENLTVSVLLSILKYYYDDKPKGLAKMSKQTLVEEVLKRFEAAAAKVWCKYQGFSLHNDSMLI